MTTKAKAKHQDDSDNIRCNSCGQIFNAFEVGYVGLRDHLLQRHQTQIGDWYCLREYFKKV